MRIRVDKDGLRKIIADLTKTAGLEEYTGIWLKVTTAFNSNDLFIVTLDRKQVKRLKKTISDEDIADRYGR